MGLALKDFQIKAIRELLEAMDSSVRDIILKSPTGSGKTIILTHFMDEYVKGHGKTVFVWLTPGKGDLEEQSKAKMDKYVHNAQTKLLPDVMTEGFAENDHCFINWEKLTKKGNAAQRDGERTNFSEWIGKALDDGLSFKIVIDESHQNFTEKAEDVVRLFRTDKIIRCSATPQIDRKAKLIEVKEEDVIAEGLIKKMLVINEDFPQTIDTDEQTAYLLGRALQKQRELHSLLLSRGVKINPLIVVQLPNSSDQLLDGVIRWFETNGVSLANRELAVWLSARHENLEGISESDGKQTAVVIKQAIATGWDCPRAYILVKLRDNMDETFEIQTIGRIRRMPEAKHYENDTLDSCYLYTFDGKFTQGVKSSLGKAALEAKTLFLKNEYKRFTLPKQQRTMIREVRDPRRARTAIATYYRRTFELTGDKKQNGARLESAGYLFSEKIVGYTLSGNVVVLDELSEKDKLNVVRVEHVLNTHSDGREYHNRVGRIGLEIGLEYRYVNTIVGKLFGDRFEYRDKLLSLSAKRLYAFVINNFDLLRRAFREAMAIQLAQGTFPIESVSEKPFTIPQSTLFTYDLQNRIQTESVKNVYQGYLMSAEKRSSSEKQFEKYCENSPAVDWFYKNGDKGDEYFSILYLDNSNRQKLFYPDYIVSVRGKVWIIETKGGFSKAGDSEDIDIFSPKKFEVLKAYLAKHGLKGGFVRCDKQSEELCICTDNYNDDIHSSAWSLLGDIIR